VGVLGESYTPDDEEDSEEACISNVWLYPTFTQFVL
jgi:hypothetical protein